MRKNRKPQLQVDDNVKLNAKELSRGAQAFDDWHWGIEPNKVIDWGDKDYPPMLIECGRLVRMHIRAPDGKVNPSRHPRRKRDTMIQLSRDVSSNSHVAYDPDHPNERLYLLVAPGASNTLAKRFWTDNAMRPMPLSQLAAIAGGRHGKRQDYPNVSVKPIGILTGLVYYTHKKGDENPGNKRSYYIHKMGEMTRFYPILAGDAQGRLWLAGGNYSCPSPGITD